MAKDGLTPEQFREKLKNGAYQSITGARKAISKSGGWTEKNREAMRALANKHWGVEESTPAPKKAAKKVAKEVIKKAPVKRVAKKAAKKSAKKVAKAAVPEAPTPKAPRAVKAPRTQVTETALVGVGKAIADTRNAVQAYSEAVEVLRKCQVEGQNINEGLAKAAAGVTQLIDAMDTSIVQPLTGFYPSPAEERGAELFRKAAPSAVMPGNGGPPLATPPVVPPVAPTVSPVIPPTYT